MRSFKNSPLTGEASNSVCHQPWERSIRLQQFWYLWKHHSFLQVVPTEQVSWGDPTGYTEAAVSLCKAVTFLLPYGWLFARASSRAVLNATPGTAARMMELRPTRQLWLTALPLFGWLWRRILGGRRVLFILSCLKTFIFPDSVTACIHFTVCCHSLLLSSKIHWL